MNSQITIKNCKIENSKAIVFSNINWQMNKNEAWLIIGQNGSGKDIFLEALTNFSNHKIIPNINANCDSLYSSVFGNSVELVSLERAAKIIEEERQNDESEFIEGGVDIGRTGRFFIAQGLYPSANDKQKLLEEASQIEKYDAIKLCGIQNILDRGLKYMSTGEIRRTLLARSLICSKKLIILSDPFSGLDTNSRTILFNYIEKLTKQQTNLSNYTHNDENPTIILSMERYNEIPKTITHVLEIKNKEISFCGTRKDYEILINENLSRQNTEEQKKTFSSSVTQTLQETKVLQNQDDFLNQNEEKTVLVQMNNVNVTWGDHTVLKNINWTLYKGEHWLIQGPNGCGKTTLLELITGNNMQVFSNDIKIFGNKRGSGETIWDIKKQLGIVSYRLHVEYRMVGGTSLQNVIISGFKDSIGLYDIPSDVEIDAAKKWLKLGGFEGRENDMFGDLSYGEQRSILILRSVVKSPKILILDEPCHALDEQQRQNVLNLIETIAYQNTTTILHVTHDPTEVLECEKHIFQFVPEQEPMYILKTK